MQLFFSLQNSSTVLRLQQHTRIFSLLALVPHARLDLCPCQCINVSVHAVAYIVLVASNITSHLVSPPPPLSMKRVICTPHFETCTILITPFAHASCPAFIFSFPNYIARSLCVPRQHPLFLKQNKKKSIVVNATTHSLILCLPTLPFFRSTFILHSATHLCKHHVCCNSHPSLHLLPVPLLSNGACKDHAVMKPSRE